MTKVEQILNKLNVKYTKTWSNWKINYYTSTSVIVEKVNLKNRCTISEKQMTLTESVHVNGLFTPETAVEDVLDFLHS